MHEPQHAHARGSQSARPAQRARVRSAIPRHTWPRGRRKTGGRTCTRLALRVTRVHTRWPWRLPGALPRPAAKKTNKRPKHPNTPIELDSASLYRASPHLPRAREWDPSGCGGVRQSAAGHTPAWLARHSSELNARGRARHWPCPRCGSPSAGHPSTCPRRSGPTPPPSRRGPRTPRETARRR